MAKKTSKAAKSERMKAINKTADKLQEQSGYEMRTVTVFEKKQVQKRRPKLSRSEALKRAHKLYKS